jgi:hypothetical protein
MTNGQIHSLPTSEGSDTDDVAAKDVPRGKKVGAIDLVRLFEAEAVALMNAVERGELLHGTFNIRDSGAPLEQEFRNFLSRKLPSQFRVLTGYLFDTSSKCTPQIDATILGASECHEVMQSGEGASYVPFTSALAIFEIKNSTYSAKDSLNQLAKITKSINEMRKQVDWKGKPPSPLLSVMLFAKTDGCKVEDFRDWYQENEDGPTYVVLLDRGIIITHQTLLAQFLEYDDKNRIEYNDHEVPGELRICSPGAGKDYQKGRILLWLYYTIVSYLNCFEENRPGVRAFTNDAVKRFPLFPGMKLNDAKNWSEEVSRSKPTTLNPTDCDQLFGSEG